MIAMESKAGDEMERFIEVRAMGWEWWVVIAAVVYFAIRLAPWVWAGCPVYL